jgi:hypothetical protein
MLLMFATPMVGAQCIFTNNSTRHDPIYVLQTGHDTMSIRARAQHHQWCFSGADAQRVRHAHSRGVRRCVVRLAIDRVVPML